MAEVAVGLVLGVLPLLISTAEHFDDIALPFRRYRDFHEGVKKFHGSLQTQKTIFRNFCELLLKTFVNNELAVRVLDRRADATEELDQKLSMVLGSSADACLRIIEEVETILCNIAGEKFLEVDIEDEEKSQTQDAILATVHLSSKSESPAGSRRSSQHQSSRHKTGGHGERERSSQRDRNGDHHRGIAHTSSSHKHRSSSSHRSRSRSISQSQSPAGSSQSSHYGNSGHLKSSHRERERSSHIDRVGGRERGREHTASSSRKHYQDGSLHRYSSKYHYCGVSEVTVEPEMDLVLSMRRKFLRKALRVKFSISKSRLEGYLAQLKSLNGDFGTLQAQVQQLAKSQSVVIDSTCQPLSRNVRHFRIIQKSSQQLYNVLAKSCTLHLEHTAHFSVEAEHTAPSAKSPSQIKFSLALTHRTSQDLHSAEVPLWMVVESTSLEDCAATMPRTSPIDPGSLIVGLKRECNKASQGSKRLKKNVRFEGAIPTTLNAPLQHSFSTPGGIEDIHICQAGNLCTVMRATLRKVAKGKSSHTDSLRTCIGVLDQNDEYRQVVYPLFRESTLSEPITLSDILSTPAADHSDIFSQYERIRLARTLATAILQYHATPWLSTAWRSRDVYFFDPGTNASPKLATPHLMTKITPSGRPVGLETKFNCQPFAFNQVLFGLGVVLLELGHEANLQNMQRFSPLAQIDPNHAAASIEFFESQRLANLVGNRMGSTYARIVQQCLRCDFGCGANLEDTRLQERVYKDVICELEDLELKFKALDMI